jgi:hypothetical protein
VEDYQLDKWIWTETDFETMGWHDSLVYAFKFDRDLYFDIDYIFKWVPDQDRWFSFWMAPCTLVFDKPTEFSINLEKTNFYDGIGIAGVHRQLNQKGKTEWRIETHLGDIMIETETFKQIVRRPPTQQPGQQVIPEERGEVSFAIISNKNFIESPQIKQIKQAQFNLQQKATNARKLQNELFELFNKRAKGELDTKQYILQKRELEKQLNTIKQELRESEVEHLTDPNF